MFDEKTMKRIFTVLILFALLSQKNINAQNCANGGINYQLTEINYSLFFQDYSFSPLGWNKEYTHWDFGDGTLDTGNYFLHTFPDTLIYTVKSEVKFTEPGNPSNFCIKYDSVQVDISSLIVYPNPHFKMEVKWLYGLTYGISSYHYGLVENLFEIVADTGLSVTEQGCNIPMQGIFTSHQEFFTYTFPTRGDYTITLHTCYPIPSGGVVYIIMIYGDSIPQTPTNCHATFFMVPDTTEINSWILYNFSSGSDLSYSWDFGDGSTSIEENPVHLYDSVGLYTICLTISNDSCSDTYCEKVFGDSCRIGYGMQKLRVVRASTGISENISKDIDIKVFPNPAENFISIQMKESSEEVNVQMYDQLGREKIKQVIKTNTRLIEFNVTDLAPGLYFIKLYDNSAHTLGSGIFMKK
jgi:PKD repeat protein